MYKCQVYQEVKRKRKRKREAAEGSINPVMRLDEIR
jgi:hypothetical protein